TLEGRGEGGVEVLVHEPHPAYARLDTERREAAGRAVDGGGRIAPEDIGDDGRPARGTAQGGQDVRGIRPLGIEGRTRAIRELRCADGGEPGLATTREGLDT